MGFDTSTLLLLGEICLTIFLVDRFLDLKKVAHEN